MKKLTRPQQKVTIGLDMIACKFSTLPNSVRKKIDPSPNGCWLWQSYKEKTGYARFNIRVGKNVLVHRFVYETLKGPIPHELTIHHKCGIKHCCNPKHMTLITRGEHNSLHKRRAHCTFGHPIKLRSNGERYCQECNRQQAKKYRANNPEKCRQTIRNWHLRNPGKHWEAVNRWRAEKTRATSSL